jgi:hypothetical protein
LFRTATTSIMILPSRCGAALMTLGVTSHNLEVTSHAFWLSDDHRHRCDDRCFDRRDCGSQILSDVILIDDVRAGHVWRVGDRASLEDHILDDGPSCTINAHALNVKLAKGQQKHQPPDSDAEDDEANDQLLSRQAPLHLLARLRQLGNIFRRSGTHGFSGDNFLLTHHGLHLSASTSNYSTLSAH